MEETFVDEGKALEIVCSRLDPAKWEVLGAYIGNWQHANLTVSPDNYRSIVVGAIDEYKYIKNFGLANAVPAEREFDAVLTVNAKSVLSDRWEKGVAFWQDKLGQKIEIGGPPEEWHATILAQIDSIEKATNGREEVPSWDWFHTWFVNEATASLEARTARPPRDNVPYVWVGKAARFKHPVSDTQSVPVQLLVAKEAFSESIAAVFRRNFAKTGRPCLLLCNDAEFNQFRGARFLLAAPGLDWNDKVISVSNPIEFRTWVTEHAPGIFKDHVETVTVAENDLTPTHDGPHPDPKLGFKEIAVELHRTIEAVRESAREGGVDPSITIGLFGPWGSGKSTLIGALETRLRASGRDADGTEFAVGGGIYDIVEVNAWKWDGSKTLAAHMLDRVLAVMGERLEEHAKTKGLGKGAYATFLKFMEKRVVPLAPILFLLTFLGVAGVWLWGTVKPYFVEDTSVSEAISWLFPVVTAIVATLSKVFQETLKELFGKLFQKEVVKVSDQQKLEKAYAEIREVSNTTGRTLAFFIDDLDRCTPERVGEFVESIHNLTSAGCVTVVACDEEYVAAALNARYADIVRYHPDGSDFGRGFLEKIVQVGFRMPALTEAGVREAGLIAPAAAPMAPETAARLSGSDRTLELPDDVFDMIVEKGGSARVSTEHELAHVALSGPKEEAATKIDTKFVSDSLDEMVKDFVQPLGINMRRVKALRNTVGLYLRIAVARGDLASDDHDGASRLSAFLVADLLDRSWLDAYRLDQLEDYMNKPGLGALSGREPLQEKLKEALGAPEGLDDLYRLLGRRARGLAKAPDASS